MSFELNHIPPNFLESLENTIVTLQAEMLQGNNNFLDLERRRKRATSVMRMLLNLEIDPHNSHLIDYIKKLKKEVKKVNLENWTKQALIHPIIHSERLKTEVYENIDPFSSIPFLEPRDYMGINPYVDSDIDDLSLVTALTPPGYTQRWHYHEETYEISFYSGPSKAKYISDGEEREMEMNTGEIAIFEPRTNHTISNHSNEPVRNASIKLPTSLIDRGEDQNFSQSGGGRKITMEEISRGVYRSDFDWLPIPYSILMYRFSEKVEHNITANSQTLLYVMNGDFNAKLDNNDTKHALSNSDVIYLDEGKSIDIQELNKDNNSVVYRVSKL